jgi:hypothetical protein
MLKYLYVISTFIFFLTSLSYSQFRTPRPSPDATISHYVGVTTVTIDYSSPGVKNRKIWGEVVPYGQVWRTGANEVTSITFTDPVKVNGNDLLAGTYGIHTIPGEQEWEIIFSKDTKVDAGAGYDSTKDALRLKVKPQEAPFTERMIFTVTDLTNNAAKVNLIWEKLKISFDVETATEDLTLQKARDSFDWGALNNAANYCLQNNINLEEGYKWIQASIIVDENYWNKRIEAQLLAKMDKKKDAIAAMEKAVEYGSKLDNAPFDFDNMKNMLTEWKGQ